MIQVLLANAYFYRFDAKQWKTGQPFPPYGTLSAAACLREAGFGVQLFDVSLRSDPTAITTALQSQRPKYLVIYDDGFNYLTKMCLTRMRDAAMQMAQIGRQFGCRVVVGSSDSTDHYAAYLQQGADFIVMGEGEITLRELLVGLETGTTDFRNISGIAFVPKGEATPVKTAPRPVLNDLDRLPDPAWDLVDIESYRRIWMQRHGRFTLNLATTRGCPYKCNWCAKPIYGNRYNTRSPERVTAEIKWLITHFQVHDFWMADDIFGLKPGWVQRFRDLIREQQLVFTFKIQSRVDLLLKEDNISALADAGLRQVWVGAESGAQTVLDAMDKGTTIEEIREATRLCKKKGVEVCFFLQFGYLGESKADILATMNLVEELQPHDIGISISYPLPGTLFYEKVKNSMGEKKNWSVSDDLDMMYPSTFPPAYYKRLHRLVHKRFRLQQGLRAWINLFQNGNGQWKSALKVLYYAPAAWLDGMLLRRLEQFTD